MIKVSGFNQKNMQKRIGLILLFVCIATIIIAGCTSQPAPTPAAVTTTAATPAASIATPVSTVKENTDKTTLGETNAALKAKQYLRTMAFSRTGLIEQLEYEGYTPQQAEYGVDQSGADWNEQAALKAKQYLRTMTFSRTGLIEQLEYEGFTPQQAEYGVQAVGY
jgi:hypothetical protein